MTPRVRTGTLQLMCRSGKQGRLLHSVVPSPGILPAPSPPLPCHMAAVQLGGGGGGLPGTEKHTALNDIFALILHAVMSLLPPTNTTQYIKNTAKAITEFIHCICYSFQIHSKIKCQLSLFTHEGSVIWKLFYIHLSLLMANPNARPWAIFHVASH